MTYVTSSGFSKCRQLVRFVYTLLLITALCVNCLAESKVTESPRSGKSVDFSRGPLMISSNKRFLVHKDGTPFFYLGDTAWELFHRVKRELVDMYLENRRAKGFTVIQAVLLGEHDGVRVPNPYGDKPLIDEDPAKPNEAYFKHVDYIINKAAEKGIYMGILPTWGDKLPNSKPPGRGPQIFNTSNARAYGEYLGKRYKNSPNIIWILGGDRKGDEYLELWRAMAAGIKAGDGGNHLITLHPTAPFSSSDWFHDEPWLDFNIMQTGHFRYDDPNSYLMITKDYNKKPVKPTLDSEPRYEYHAVNWKWELGWFDDFDVRQASYWSIFAGGAGITYGCQDIWPMLAPGRKSINGTNPNWYDRLDLPGAWDMLHVRNLMESRPYLDRIPDQSMLSSGEGEGAGHLQATRGKDYAFIYTPLGEQFTVKLGLISGKNIKAWWFDPRTGTSSIIGKYSNKSTRKFVPPGKPGRGNDWILVLDDASKQFPPPGQPYAVGLTRNVVNPIK
jgi:hypothetical protein